MAVSTDLNKHVYIGNGTNKTWSVTFRLLQASDLHLYLTNTETSVITEITTNYSISPTGGSYPCDTATVTYPSSGDAITSTYKLTLVRQVAVTQTTVYPTNTALKPKTVEKDLDKSAMIDQQLAEELVRCIKTPISDEGTLDTDEYLTQVLSATASSLESKNDSAASAAAALVSEAAAANYAAIMPEYNLESTGYGVINGLGVTVSGMTATVAIGTVHMPSGQRIPYTSTTAKTIPTADATNPRIDLIYIASNETITYLVGTAAASPVAPTLPSGGFALVNITVAAGATSITSADLTDERIIKPNYKNSLIVSVADFGAVGDGVTDDTVAIQSAVTAGRYVTFPDSDTYMVTSSINVPANTEIVLNNSTVNFVLSTTIPGFNVKGDNVIIRGGTIDVIGATMGGSGPSLNCIAAGNQTDGTGYKNLRFSDLAVSTNRTDAGASIGIMGECSDVVIENIYIPDNAYCRNVIGCEWGGTADTGTGHPHDIKINNIRAGSLTYQNTSYGYLVWLSSCFNVTVTNLYADECFGLAAVMTGDKSNDYAPDRYKSLVGTGITLDNLTCNKIFGYGVRVYGKGSLSTTVLDQSAKMTNINLKASSTATNNVLGVSFGYCNGTQLSKFVLDGFYVGFATDTDVKYPVVENGKILNSKVYGLGFGSSGGYCINPTARNIHFQGNNTNAGTGTGSAAIVLTYTKHPAIERCTFGEIGVTETQKYSITCTANTVNPTLNNNHTYNILSGGIAYSINVQSTPEINAQGINNTSESGITNHGGAPIFNINTAGNREFILPTNVAPTVGTWAVGDKGHNPIPTLTKNISYWECITAGTPGTWVAYGCGTGTTATRPTLTTQDTGYLYRDTTTGTMVMWSGTAWI